MISPFLMVNHISSTDPKARGPSNKAKGGLAMTFTPLRWFGAGARYDTVHPDLSDSTQSFQVISPKVILRSDYASHEYVAIQYNAYINGEAVTPVYPRRGRPIDTRSR